VIAIVVSGGLIGSSVIGIWPRAAARAPGCTSSPSLVGLSTVLGVWLLWSVLRSGRL